MKLQYMGDCRDFYKYDLLLALGRALQPPVGLTVVPMLTLGGSPREGNLRSYRARHRDPGLHALVQSLVQGNVHELQRVADYFNAHGRYFRLAITLAKRKEDAIALLRARLSALLLISNDPRCTALELLREYIEQMSVEQGFRFIKEPRHIAPVFLKRPDRIEAFAYV